MWAERAWGREEVSARRAGLGWEAGLVPEGRGLRSVAGEAVVVGLRSSFFFFPGAGSTESVQSISVVLPCLILVKSLDVRSERNISCGNTCGEHP